MADLETKFYDLREQAITEYNRLKQDEDFCKMMEIDPATKKFIESIDKFISISDDPKTEEITENHIVAVKLLLDHVVKLTGVMDICDILDKQ